YLVQFTEPDEADVIVGHVLRGELGDEVVITILAACIDKPAPKATFDFPELDEPLPQPEEEAESVIDIPTFLSRKRQQDA
ncbi:MAG: hypothetical protein D6724_01350, partial [Armatimonadetes bacterium]